jgi:ABC-type branched-subunit amino acid transport system ATPase component/ABC-type branched-subunit amino acid transport system permease subunit
MTPSHKTDVDRPAWLPMVVLAACFSGLIAAAWFANGYYVFVIATLALTAIVGIGLNVLTGLTGQVSFGHVGFYAIGAYTVAILTTTAKLPLLVALPAAAAIAGLMGMVLAIPALRVRGPYLAMVTIAFGFMVEHGLVEWRGLTGGQNGIMGVPPLTVFGASTGERGVAVAGLLLAALFTWAYWKFAASPLGKAMRAVKDSEIAAESIGLNPVVIKTAAFSISAVCAGLAGGLFSPLSGFVTPSTFAFSQSILFVLVVMIGGAGTIAGPLVGAVIVVLLPEFLASLAEYRLLFFGALMLVVLWIAPDGIVGAIGRLTRRHAPLFASHAAGPADAVRPRAGSALQVSDLSIAFGGVKAVTGLSLEAPAGHITSLIGPNGAGKTTVLNMLSGFYRPAAGSIRLGTTSLEGRHAWAISRAGVARTYQTSQLFGSLSVIDNLTIAVACGKVEPPFVRGAIGRRNAAVGRGLALVRFVGYTGDLARPASELSHVDRRLIEIARALATNPAVLLLDEPAAGLSREDKTALGVLLKRIAATGVALVLVEHDMALVMGVSDRVVVIDAGVRIAAGLPVEVQQNDDVKRAYLGEGAGNPRTARLDSTASLGKSLLETTGLEAGYGAVSVLKKVDLDVREHEMVAVLGANGAGKSTLMRALSGLIRPVGGAVTLAGVPLATQPAHRVAAAGLTLVPEGRQVFPAMSVLDNIRLGAFLRKDGTEPVARDLEAMLERFPRLRERARQRAGLLSGGEQQMLAIARGLMARPKLLLLDEPSLGLAPAIIEELFAALDRLRNEKITILLVDQMAGLALALSDRAYVIEGGQIIASGTPDEIAGNDSLERAYLGAA